MKRKSWFWTRTEDELLRRAYGKVPVKRISAATGRTVPAVYKRAQALGLNDSGAYRIDGYTDAQLRVLIAGYPTRDLDELAEELGKTCASVRTKARRLGLKREAR